MAVEFILENLNESSDFEILENLNDQVFWTAILSFCIRGKSDSKNSLFLYFKNMPEKEIFIMESKVNLPMSKIIEEAARNMVKDFNNQIIGKIPILIAKILKETSPEVLEQKTKEIEEYLKLTQVIVFIYNIR